MLPLAVSFIEIGGKQKITIASICDKKETFRYSSRDIKGRLRSRAVRLSIILAFHIALTQDFRVYEGTRDQPMPGPFPAPPIFYGKSPGDEVEVRSINKCYYSFKIFPQF